MTQLEKDVDRIGRAGQAAWRRLKKHKSWTDWMAVGEALVAGRTMAMRGAETNKPEGKGYNQLFSQYLTHYGLAEIDKSTRAKLLQIMTVRGEIEDYRNALPQNLRLELNHPVTVLRRWQRDTRVTKPKAPKAPDESEALQAHITELEAAREAPIPLAGAREAYLAHLRHVEMHEWQAELDALGRELVASTSPAAMQRAIERQDAHTATIVAAMAKSKD